MIFSRLRGLRKASTNGSMGQGGMSAVPRGLLVASVLCGGDRLYISPEHDLMNRLLERLGRRANTAALGLALPVGSIHAEVGTGAVVGAPVATRSSHRARSAPVAALLRGRGWSAQARGEITRSVHDGQPRSG